MESITHARALTVGAGRGGGGGGVGVGGHGANERVATSSSGGSRVMSERNESWHLWPADGQKANWRMCGAPCARRVRFFRSLRRPAVSVAERSVGETPLCESAAAAAS